MEDEPIKICDQELQLRILPKFTNFGTIFKVGVDSFDGYTKVFRDSGMVYRCLGWFGQQDSLDY